MIESRDGAPIDAKWIEAGTWDVEIAGGRHAAVASLRPLFDPDNAKIKG